MSGLSSNAFFILQAPTAPPDIPERWSWSALQAWRKCPRQWWLLRAKYPNSGTPYPQPIHPAAVEGILLHHAIEMFVGHVTRASSSGTMSDQEIRQSFPARRVIQERLRAMVLDRSNERLDFSALLPRVSVDECVNGFRTIAPSCLEHATRGPSLAPTAQRVARPAQYGAEVSLEVLDPPLQGRLDYVTTRGIVDFKTGRVDALHQDQLRFYALLVWLATGTSPAELRILYSSGDQIAVPMPSDDELQAMADGYRAEIATIVPQIASGPPQANANSANCATCPVRHLCEEYWEAAETAGLRLSGTRAPPSQMEDGRYWIDVELSELPPMNAAGGFTGRARARDLGEVRLSIGRRHAAVIRSSRGVRARLLNASVEAQNGQVTVEVTRGSEAFWLVPPEE